MPLEFVLRRTVTALLTLVLASVMVFGALLVVPGDPVQLLLGLDYNQDQYQAVQKQLGLDKPPLERYLHWIAGLPRGDFGSSISESRPVLEAILARLPVTVPLILASSLLALMIALPMGIWAAQRKGSVFDLAVVTLTQMGLAIPSFWLGLMLVIVFAVNLRWLPSGGWTAWSEDPMRSARSLILPVVTLALGQAAGLVRMVRSSVLEVSGQEFVRTARGKGLLEVDVVRKHILRNAWIPILTLFGIQLGQLLAGSIIVESVYQLPGLGALGIKAVKSIDFPLLQGVVLLISSVIVGINLLVDLLYGALDPRIRYD